MLSLAIDVHASREHLVLVIVMTFRKVKTFGGNSQESMRVTNNSNFIFVAETQDDTLYAYTTN